MREFNLLAKYPQPPERLITNRTIEDRILAAYRGMDFFDGPRSCGYGGMIDDGRWEKVAQDIADHYAPWGSRRIVQFGCEKGFLLKELAQKGFIVIGVDSSSYARSHSHPYSNIIPAIPSDQLANPFDLALALGLVYTSNLGDAMSCIRMVERVAHKAFITLMSAETKEKERLLRRWTLLGTTILSKADWLEVLKHCGYTGDYWFITSKYLRLREST
mgnify:FL=1